MLIVKKLDWEFAQCRKCKNCGKLLVKLYSEKDVSTVHLKSLQDVTLRNRHLRTTVCKFKLVPPHLIPKLIRTKYKTHTIIIVMRIFVMRVLTWSSTNHIFVSFQGTNNTHRFNFDEDCTRDYHVQLNTRTEAELQLWYCYRSEIRNKYDLWHLQRLILCCTLKRVTVLVTEILPGILFYLQLDLPISYLNVV